MNRAINVSFLAVVLVFVSPARSQLAASGSTNTPAAVPSRLQTPRTNDADGLTELFERVSRTGGIAYLPGGVYRINKTVHINEAGPIRIEGEGAGEMFGAKGFKSMPTVLYWTGEKGGTMLLIENSVGQTISHLQLDGNNSAGTLIQLRGKSGWGPSSQRFERVTFRNAELGIQVGEKELDHNCDNLIYDETVFTRVGTGVRVMNHQAVNHHFRSLVFHHVGTVLDFERGGNVLVDGFTGGSFDLFCKISHGGVNCGTYRFVAGRPEMNGHTRRYARLLEAFPADLADIVFESVQESGGPFDESLPDNATDPVFHIGQRAVVTTLNHVHQFAYARVEAGGYYRDRYGRWSYDPSQVGRFTLEKGIIDVAEATDRGGAPLNDFKRAK